MDCVFFFFFVFLFFFQAEDGIRDLVRSRGLGDVYKRQILARVRLVHQENAGAVTTGSARVEITGREETELSVETDATQPKHLSLIHI